jgi:fucokinase
LLATSYAIGVQLTRTDLVRLVLKVEQLLSTGGGWQDQIGSIFPGFKSSASPAKLPIQVQVTQLNVNDAFLAEFERRSVLVQTGPARLARDLLQVVIRRWHRREPSFCNAIDSLRQGAQALSSGLLAKDFNQVAKQVNEYWRLKKIVSGESQAEPELIQQLFAETKPLVIANMLCGAGGGGFAFFLLNQEVTFDAFTNLVRSKFPDMKVFPVSVCNQGVKLWSESTGEIQVT